ncbi:zinc finger protein 430-like [Argonauta hians]
MEYAQILPRRFCPVIIQHTLEREKSTKQLQFAAPLQEKQYKNVSNCTSTEIQFQRPENLSRIPEITPRHQTYSQMDVYCNPRNLTRTRDEFSNKQLLLPYNEFSLGTNNSYSREEKCKIERKNHITDNEYFKHVSPTNYNMYSREYFENHNFNPCPSLKFKNNYPIDKPVAYDTIVGKLPFTGDVVNNTGLCTQNIHSFLTEYEEKSRDLRNSKSHQRRVNICPFCNIFKTSRAQLKIHLRIHTGNEKGLTPGPSGSSGIQLHRFKSI